jgi:hypothetical protein
MLSPASLLLLIFPAPPWTAPLPGSNLPMSQNKVPHDYVPMPMHLSQPGDRNRL